MDARVERVFLGYLRLPASQRRRSQFNRAFIEVPNLWLHKASQASQARSGRLQQLNSSPQHRRLVALYPHRPHSDDIFTAACERRPDNGRPVRLAHVWRSPFNHPSRMGCQAHAPYFWERPTMQSFWQLEKDQLSIRTIAGTAARARPDRRSVNEERRISKSWRRMNDCTRMQEINSLVTSDDKTKSEGALLRLPPGGAKP